MIARFCWPLIIVAGTCSPCTADEQADPAAAKVVRQYLEAKNWEERLALVLHPERVKPLMEAKYSGAKFRTPTIVAIDEPKRAGDWLIVRATIEVGGRHVVDYPVRNTAQGFRIDGSPLWEPTARR